MGKPEMVAHTSASCTEELTLALENLDMKVSRREPWASIGDAKTAIAVSHRSLASIVATLMRRLGVLVTRKAKHLGVEFGPGARTRVGDSKRPRWTLNAARRARVI